MISTKQIRFLLKGAKKLNAGIASVKRFGRPAEEIGMTFSEGARLQKMRAGLSSSLHAGVQANAARAARSGGLGAAHMGAFGAARATAMARNASLGQSMAALGAHASAAGRAASEARTAGQAARFAGARAAYGKAMNVPTLNRMPAAQGASLLRRAKVGGMQLVRSARKRGFTPSALRQGVSNLGTRTRSAYAAFRG